MLACLKSSRTLNCSSLPAVDGDGMVAGLLLLLLHCRDDVDHALTIGGDAHLRPAVEMKLTHRSSLVFLETQGSRHVLKGTWTTKITAETLDVFVSHPVVGDQEVPNSVALVLLLPFDLDGDVPVHH